MPMRIEYGISDFPLDVFNAIDNFFASTSSVYSLIDSQLDRRVYHSNDENIDIIFAYFLDVVCVVATPVYNSSLGIFEQEGAICSGYQGPIKFDIVRDEDGREISSKKCEGYGYPAPVLTNGNKLVANYNEDNNTYMFSLIKDFELDYGFTQATIHRTKSIMLGSVTKSLDFDGGFFYGGDFIYIFIYYWRYNEQNIFMDTGVLYVRESELRVGLNGAVKSNRFDTSSMGFSGEGNTLNRFDFFLRIDVDNSLHYSPEILTDRVFNPITPILSVNKYIWASTLKCYGSIPMRCSIDYIRHELQYPSREFNERTNPMVEVEKLLPTYRNFISKTCVDMGQTVNTLNGISLVLYLWFMVRRDPAYLDTYSMVGYNTVINFVNMFNMDTNRIINGSFPVVANQYNCFQSGNRRSLFGMKGYSGIAFRTNISDVDPVTPPNLSLLDIPFMEKHLTGGSILNIKVSDGRDGYGGDASFDNMTYSSFVLKHPYTEFDAIKFTFTNDWGSVIEDVVWTKEQLDEALNGNVVFNLLPSDTAIMWGSDSGEWGVAPFSQGSTSKIFINAVYNKYGQNCGLIGCVGIHY